MDNSLQINTLLKMQKVAQTQSTNTWIASIFQVQNTATIKHSSAIIGKERASFYPLSHWVREARRVQQQDIG